MASLVIACLSQKGGVGKSTLARLLARTYASAGWSVKIADFNVRQKTSVDWAAVRMTQDVSPAIAAESFVSTKTLRKENHDLIVADGKPDSDQSSLEIARSADICVLPTGLTADDLKPQAMFANELVTKGVDRSKILFVLNKTTESHVAVAEARQYLESIGYLVCKTDLSTKTGYQMAQNTGRSIAETNYHTLNERADALAAEIVARINVLQGEKQ